MSQNHEVKFGRCITNFLSKLDGDVERIPFCEQLWEQFGMKPLDHCASCDEPERTLDFCYDCRLSFYKLCGVDTTPPPLLSPRSSDVYNDEYDSFNDEYDDDECFCSVADCANCDIYGFPCRNCANHVLDGKLGPGCPNKLLNEGEKSLTPEEILEKIRAHRFGEDESESSN
jgi:hypothetical protein